MRAPNQWVAVYPGVKAALLWHRLNTVRDGRNRPALCRAEKALDVR
jgi:hypothetical protein